MLGGWLVIALVKPTWRPTTPLLLPVALASAAYFASFVASQRPRLSLEPTIAGLGWALAFLFLTRLLAEDWFRARIAVLMSAFVAAVAIGYVAQVIAEWLTWWGLVGRFAVPPLRPSFVGLFLGSPNLVGTALLLLAPLVIAVTWGRNRRPRIAAALAVASALAIFLSGSRGAWLGVGIGVVVALALYVSSSGFRRRRISLRGRSEQARRQRLLLMPIGLIALGAGALAPSVIQRFAQGGATLRLDLWRSAISIFAEHPLLGAGPGTWVQLKVTANPEGVPNLVLPHAHDLYVQAAAEVGVFGLVALAFVAVAVLLRLLLAWRSTDRRLSIEAAAVLVSVAAFAAQSVVDNLVNLPFVCLILVTLVAWVEGGLTTTATSKMRATGGWRRVLERGPAVAIVGLIGLALVVPTLLRIDRAATLAQRGNDYALRGHWPLALEAYDAARREDPGFTLYEIQAASALARVGRTADARDLLATAVASDPIAINIIGLAALDAELGDRQAALANLAKAREFGLGEPTVALNAGLIAQRLADRELAIDAFADAIASDPPLAGNGIWESVRSITRAEIVNKAMTRVDPLDGALILAYSGDPRTARTLLEALPTSSRREVYLAATTWLIDGPIPALSRLEELLHDGPGDWFAAAWAARIGRLSDNGAALNRFSKWAIAVQGDAAPAVIGERSQVPAGFDAPTAGLPGTYPWAVYLRPISPYLLMPQLVTIGDR